MSDEKRFKRLIIDWSDDPLVLVDQAQIAKEYGPEIEVGNWLVVRRGDGTSYLINANKKSIRVRIND